MHNLLQALLHQDARSIYNFHITISSQMGWELFFYVKIELFPGSPEFYRVVNELLMPGELNNDILQVRKDASIET